MAIAADSDRRDRLKVFLSYSRRDLEMADRLVDALESAGFAVSIDRRDLPYGEEWQAELSDFIRGADTVIWLVSPHSLGSHWVNWELGEVQRLNKRLIPVAIDAVDPETLPKQLGKIHVLPAESVFALDRHLAILVETLNTDRAWIKEHTRLADRARQWLARGRPSALLLRGSALRDAFKWQADKPRAAPPPSEEVLELLLASRRAQGRRQRLAVAASLLVAVAGVALAAYALWQRGIAVEQTAIAETNEARAIEQQGIAEANEARTSAERDKALTTQSRFLADLANQQARAFDYGTAVALALEALPDPARNIDRPFVKEADDALASAIKSLRETKVLKGHTDDILAAVFSPDGTRVVTASSDRTARVWDAASGEVLFTLEHPALVWTALFYPDGSRILTVANGVGRIWDAQSGTLLTTFGEAGRNMERAEFSPDGSRILTTASQWDPARLWDAATGAHLFDMAGHAEGASFLPDGKHILVSRTVEGLMIFDAESGKITGTQHSGRLISVKADEISPDGGRFLLHQDGAVIVLDLENFNELLRLETPGVFEAIYSPDGQQILTSGVSTDLHDVRLWDAATGDELALIELDDDYDPAIFSPDGSMLVAGVVGGTRLWNTRGEQLAILQGNFGRTRKPMFSPDGKRLLTVNFDDTARIWDIAERVEKIAPGDLSAIAVTPDASRYVGCCFDSGAMATVGFSGYRTEIRDSATNRTLVTLVEDLTSTADVSPDGTRVATVNLGVDGNTYSRVRISDTGSGAEIAELIGQKRYVYQVAFSPDDTRVATVTDDDKADIWDTETGRVVATITGHTGRVAHASFSPDGTRLVTASFDKTAGVWSAADGSELLRLTCDAEVTLASFSPDGTRILTVSAGTLRVWDAVEGREMLKLAEQTGIVTSAVFSPDSATIVSSSDDGTLRFWDAATGNLLRVRDMGGPVHSAAFLPDGARLILGTGSGYIIEKLFQTPGALVDYARSIMPRELTPEQRKQFFLE